VGWRFGLTSSLASEPLRHYSPTVGLNKRPHQIDTTALRPNVVGPTITLEGNAKWRTRSGAKYHRYAESIIGSIVSPEARAATLKLVPR
jgi:hypothetical protein